MATIYKRSQDRSKKRAYWFIGFTDHNGVRRTKKGFTDKGETERLAAKLEHDAMLRRRGIIDPREEKKAERRKSAVALHIDAFEQSLKRTTNTPKHVKLLVSRVRRVFHEGNIVTVSDIDREQVEETIHEMMCADGFGHRTFNHYLQAVTQFCNWLVPKTLSFNPLIGLKRLNTEVDVRHRRRALSTDEFAKLVQSARESDEVIQCYDGEIRARIYLLSYYTGLRRNELASLTAKSFRIDSDSTSTLIVQAACSKHRRTDVLPLHPDLVELLAQWLPTIPPGEFLFPKLAKRRTWKMVKLDLERVGIPYKNSEGIADFHAAGRHTHITELIRSGASLPEAQKLARHSDIRMTMRYTHIGLDDQSNALNKLTTPKNRSSEENIETTEDNQGHGSTSKSLPAGRQELATVGVESSYENCDSHSIPAAST